MMATSAWVVLTTKDRDESFAMILLAVSAAMIFGTELYIVSDRMNTVFKCYLPAWLMLGTAASVLAGRWCAASLRIPPVSGRSFVTSGV